ncbi:hypothetical protein ACWEBX_38945, partial [Streptomyces sp. NPDC005070]
SPVRRSYVSVVSVYSRPKEEAISDIEDGLTEAGRFAPHQRRFRGVLAMAELDYIAQHWGDADWKLTREQMLDELGASWVRLLT